MAGNPSAGLPKVLSSAELEGYYRLVNNEQVSFAPLLAAHVRATQGRMQGLERVVVAHDTTDFRFSDEVEREGLGPMDNGGQGFYCHLALAVGAGRQALGVLAVETWTRVARDPASPKPTQRERYWALDKESLRWMRSVERVREVVERVVHVVHVMDREADDYGILSGLMASGDGFVVRAAADRRLGAEQQGQKLKAFARELDVDFVREAKLSSRRTKSSEKDRKTHPPRATRSAMLTIASERIALRRPDRTRAELPEQLELHVVYVTEPNPPAGCEPVEWILLTNQPIDTEKQGMQVIEDYRSRWPVEEYFKALKTGCAYETRQHETKDALLNTLGVFLPIAWSLLQLRSLSRDPQLRERPAAEVLTATQIEILCLQSNGKLAPSPTLREAVLALARFFGGHLPSNGEPGWQVLSRAYTSLLMAELGWRLAKAATQPPQNTSERSDL